MQVLDDGPEVSPQSNARPWNMEVDSYCTLMHFSQLAGAIVPFAGFIMPIVMWTTQKDKDPLIDEHGKNIVNFMLSAILYGIIFAILILVVIGVFLLIGLGILSLIFIIIGGIQASEGRVYKYPLTIRFIK